MTVHVLVGGQTLYNMPGLPRDWPEDHQWISSIMAQGRPDDITCDVCRRQLSKTNEESDEPKESIPRPS